MNIKKYMIVFSRILFSVVSMCAVAVQANMPLVTKTYKTGFFFQGVIVPLRLWNLGLLGIIIALIIASLIESKVICRLLKVSYKKIFCLIFFTEIISAIIQKIITFSVDSFFLHPYIKEQDTPSFYLVVSLFLIVIITVLGIKMIMQYWLINRYNSEVHHAKLKKFILYANVISFCVLGILELISYHIPITTIAY